MKESARSRIGIRRRCSPRTDEASRSTVAFGVDAVDRLTGGTGWLEHPTETSCSPSGESWNENTSDKKSSGDVASDVQNDCYWSRIWLRDDEVERTRNERRQDQERYTGDDGGLAPPFQLVKRAIASKKRPEQTESENGYENRSGILDRYDQYKPNCETVNATKQLDTSPDVVPQ